MLTEITPAMAREWIEAYTGAKDLGIMRPIRSWWVTYLAKQMRAGLFTASATVGLAKLGDAVCIVNGNHTLRAIEVAGVTMKLPVVWYECESEADVRHLYATFDHNLTRTRVDSFRAYDVADALNVTQSDAQALSSAVFFMMSEFGRVWQNTRKVADTDLLTAMRPWVPAFGKLLVVAGRGHGTPWYKRIVRRAPVCSVALVTLQYQPEMAFRFWSSVVEGVNLKRNSPALRLRDYLTETISVGSHGSRLASGGMEHQDVMAKKVAYCWNKYYQGEQIVLLRVSDKPIEILGREEPRRPTTAAPALMMMPA